MFSFIVRYLGFLKIVPGLALVFENLLILHSFFTRPVLLDYLDELKTDVLTWPDAAVTVHKYGGVQFNFRKNELGHIHGNGLLDMRFTRREKEFLLAEGRVMHHHVFKNSGWISFYIRSAEDREYALGLLYRSYLRRWALAIK